MLVDLLKKFNLGQNVEVQLFVEIQLFADKENSLVYLFTIK
jgi:hypothetical protein